MLSTSSLKYQNLKRFIHKHISVPTFCKTSNTVILFLLHKFFSAFYSCVWTHKAEFSCYLFDVFSHLSKHIVQIRFIGVFPLSFPFISIFQSAGRQTTSNRIFELQCEVHYPPDSCWKPAVRSNLCHPGPPSDPQLMSSLWHIGLELRGGRVCHFPWSDLQVRKKYVLFMLIQLWS